MARRHLVAFRDMDRCHLAGDAGRMDMLHLHRFERDDRLARVTSSPIGQRRDNAAVELRPHLAVAAAGIRGFRPRQRQVGRRDRSAAVEDVEPVAVVGYVAAGVEPTDVEGDLALVSRSMTISLVAPFSAIAGAVGVADRLGLVRLAVDVDAQRQRDGLSARPGLQPCAAPGRIEQQRGQRRGGDAALRRAVQFGGVLRDEGRRRAPLAKVGWRRRDARNAWLVVTPKAMVESSAVASFSRASSRVAPCVTSLAIIRS